MIDGFYHTQPLFLTEGIIKDFAIGGGIKECPSNLFLFTMIWSKMRFLILEKSIMEG